MILTGIGSRQTPVNILNDMEKIGEWCRSNKVLVRSGHADGADFAFEKGSQEFCIAYIPWLGFNKHLISKANTVVPTFTKEIEDTAKQFHPAWHNVSNGAKKLHMRNVCQVLGSDLKTLSSVVVCYTHDGLASGGTGQAIRIAEHFNIPILNMRTRTLDSVMRIIKDMVSQ